MLVMFLLRLCYVTITGASRCNNTFSCIDLMSQYAGINRLANNADSFCQPFNGCIDPWSIFPYMYLKHGPQLGGRASCASDRTFVTSSGGPTSVRLPGVQEMVVGHSIEMRVVTQPLGCALQPLESLPCGMGMTGC